MSYKSGFVTIIGKPNVGKSTLLNTILKEKVAIVSPKPQTTRNKITGILNEENSQIVFLDTPGMHTPKNNLDKYMEKTINKSIEGVDVLVYMLDATKPFKEDELELIQKYANGKLPFILVVNKTDASSFEKLYPKLDKLNKLGKIEEIIPLSAKTRKNVDVLINIIKKHLPEGQPYFSEDMHTDMSERFIASEIVREKALWLLQEEIPHGIAVEVLKFEEDGNLARIDVNIICEKASHKNIVIGKDGSMLKKIGTSSRKEIERMLDKKVFLNLWVKVKTNWRQNLQELNTFGYDKKKL